MELEDSRIRIYRLRSVLLENSIIRDLITEASPVFQRIQNVIDKAEPLTREDIIKSSRYYRAIIHSNLLKFSSPVTPESCKDDPKVLNEAKDMLNKINILWYLCEILFIDIHSPGVLVNQLLIWIRWHYTSINGEAEAMLKKPNVHESENFWPTLMRFIVRGEVKIAAKLLKLHPKCESSDNFMMIHSLMEKMPQYSRDQILYEFFMKWQAWNVQCRSHFKNNIHTSPEEKTILGLLSGDLGTFSSNKHLFESWFHLMVALLHFTDPLIKETDISSLARECLSIYTGIRSEQQATAFDRALLNAFSYDLMAVVQESCSAFQDNWWFLAHFLDLLYHGTILDANEIEEPKKLREFFLLDYADSLMTDPSLWSIGVDYFASCQDYGLESLRLHLQRIPLDSEKTAYEIISIAEQFNFDDVIRIIALVMAKRLLAQNNLGQALLWSARSKSPVLASHIADIFLNHFVEKKEFPDEEALTSLGSLMLTSDRLTFLAKYYEFIELKKHGSLKEAGTQLENLIASKIAPKFFILTLLMDAIPLLESETLTLDCDQTHQILIALESYLPLLNNQIGDEDLKEKEDCLRLALARNMARAMVFAV